MSSPWTLRAIRIALLAAIVAAVVAIAAPWILPRQEDGKPLVGGPFTLTDQTGKRVTDKDLRGRWALIYFGYTYCPDACPLGLQNMTHALDLLGDKAKTIRPVLITVDPARDTVAALADYAKSFHPDLLALTGSESEIAAAAKAYRVYYKKVESAQHSDYLMDHSSIIYLMDPQGRYATHFTHQTSPQDMARELAKIP
jgi:protein SCO1/2